MMMQATEIESVACPSGCSSHFLSFPFLLFFHLLLEITQTVSLRKSIDHKTVRYVHAGTISGDSIIFALARADLLRIVFVDDGPAAIAELYCLGSIEAHAAFELLSSVLPGGTKIVPVKLKFAARVWVFCSKLLSVGTELCLFVPVVSKETISHSSIRLHFSETGRTVLSGFIHKDLSIFSVRQDIQSGYSRGRISDSRDLCRLLLEAHDV